MEKAILVATQHKGLRELVDKHTLAVVVGWRAEALYRSSHSSKITRGTVDSHDECYKDLVILCRMFKLRRVVGNISRWGLNYSHRKDFSLALIENLCHE
jgi:hypothetical protein